MDYLVMECVSETLAKRLEKGPLPLDQRVLKYGSQIADGLDGRIAAA